MKRIFILFITLLIIVTAAAQKKYIKSKDLDTFVGTWEYKTATETFTIEFRKSLFETDHSKREQVHGAYKYIKNKIVLSDYLNMMSNTYTLDMPIAAENSGDTPGNMLYGIVQDKKLDKEGVLFFTLVAGKTDEARWQLMEAEGAYIKGGREAPPRTYRCDYEKD